MKVNDTIITSSGIIRNPLKPRTGIISQNSVSFEFLDEIVIHGIDLSHENYIAELEAEGKTEDEIEEECYLYESLETTYLYGDWLKVNGKYEINHNGKYGYAVTYSNDSGNICVEWSKDTKQCNNTSPCYVMSDGSGPCGDLNSVGTNVVAYCLPLDCLYTD